jgi:hypothetical protein
MPSAEEAVFDVQVYFQLLTEDNEKVGGLSFQKSYFGYKQLSAPTGRQQKLNLKNKINFRLKDQWYKLKNLDCVYTLVTLLFLPCFFSLTHLGKSCKELDCAYVAQRLKFELPCRCQPATIMHH